MSRLFVSIVSGIIHHCFGAVLGECYGDFTQSGVLYDDDRLWLTGYELMVARATTLGLLRGTTGGGQSSGMLPCSPCTEGEAMTVSLSLRPRGIRF